MRMIPNQIKKTIFVKFPYQKKIRFEKIIVMQKFELESS